MIYLIPILLTLFGVFRYDFSSYPTKREKSKTVLWISICIVWILIIGLRYRVGGDTINYMGDYEWRVSLSKWDPFAKDKYQPGYTFLCAIGKSISPDFYVFQLIHASIFNILLFIFLRKYSRYRFSALVAVYAVCYLYFSTEILRESLAIMVFCINYPSYKNRKWIQYYLGVLLACMFHLSAIFLVLLPLLRNLKVNKWLFISLGITAVAMMSLQSILSIVARHVSLVTEQIENYRNLTSAGILATLLLLIRNSIIPLLYCVCAKYLFKKEIQFENLLSIMIIIGFASFFNFILFGRATNYFYLFFCISISDFCISAIKSKSLSLRQYSIAISLIFALAYGSSFIMYKRYTLWYPYYSVYNPQKVSRAYADKMLLRHQHRHHIQRR